MSSLTSMPLIKNYRRQSHCFLPCKDFLFTFRNHTNKSSIEAFGGKLTCFWRKTWEVFVRRSKGFMRKIRLEDPFGRLQEQRTAERQEATLSAATPLSSVIRTDHDLPTHLSAGPDGVFRRATKGQLLRTKSRGIAQRGCRIACRKCVNLCNKHMTIT